MLACAHNNGVRYYIEVIDGQFHVSSYCQMCYATIKRRVIDQENQILLQKIMALLP